MFPTPVAVVLTAVFLATGLIGGLALARGARARVAGPCGDTRATELVHLLMSIAMIAMAWGWTGGPETVGGLVQVVLFGGFAAALGASGVLDIVRARRARRETRSARLSHGLTAAAMVWMVAAMPLLMHGATTPGAPATAAGHHAHGGMAHGGMAHGAIAPGGIDPATTAPGGMDPGTMAPAATALPPGAGWASAVSTVLVVLLAVVGLAWVVRAVQLSSPVHRARVAASLPASVSVPSPRPAPEPARVPVTTDGTPAPAAAPVLVRPVAPGAPTDGAPTHEGLAPGHARRPAVLAASCHALMGLGMAAMLAAMS